MIRPFSSVAVCLMIVSTCPTARACGFIDTSRDLTTLREDAARSKFILSGRLENARIAGEDGSTDFVITGTIKGNPVLDGRKVLRIPRYFLIDDPKNPPPYLVFGDVEKGMPDLFKGVQCTPELVKYLEGVMAVDGKDRVKVLRYCFDWLEHPAQVIATDAFNEFIKSTDPEIRKVGRTLVADKLRKWLQDERTPPERLRLYAFLLAQCGNEKDTVLLRTLLDRLVKEKSPPMIDGILTAYALFDPKNGWDYVCELLKNPANGFSARYGALRSARYFHTTQPEVLTQKEILRAMSLAIEQPDLADLPIEDLRKWKSWELTDRILALYGKKDFEAGIIRRSILRYALQCPQPQAARFVARMRKTDPDRVKDVEELLKAEEESQRPEAKPRSEQP